MIFGKLKPALEGIRDIGWREAVIFAPLVVLTILFGVAPKPVLDMSAASVAQLLDNYNHAIAARKDRGAGSAIGCADESAAHSSRIDRRCCRSLCWLAAPW